MTSYSNLIQAVDIALKTLQMNKLCYCAEDDAAYYFSGCADDGQRICGESTVSVDKKTLKCEYCYFDNPKRHTPKRELAIPKERENVYMQVKELY